MSTTVTYKGNTIATLNNETKTLTTAGTWVEGNITVTDTKDNPTLQAKTNITPIQSSQTITADSGYDGLSSVQINAIPENYKDSIIFTATYDENTGDLESITCNKSYSVCSVIMNDAYDYSAIYVEKEGEEYSISAMTGTEVYNPSSNEYLLKYTLTDSNFIISYHQDGTITAAERNASATTPATTITANPSISVNSSTGLITATASASQSITPTVVKGHISSGTAGTVTVSGSNTSQLSIQAGTTITPNESEQTAVSAGKYTTGVVKVGAISSTYVGSGIDRRDETDLTASGATVTVPAGFYAEQETKSVASGTEGTPTATKGTVSNNSISVTPSVTNTTGYITGGTKTGTAVTVSASELVSGTLNITSSGTKDVTNYASASVAAGTEGTPTATKGTVSNHSISVTPSVTNTTGYITGGTNTGTAVTITASELASGNKEITQNGTNIDVVGYSTVSVAVPSSSAAIITDTTDTAGGTIRTITTTDEVHLQTKTITPTSTQQTVLPDTGYDGFSSVIVGASSGGGDTWETLVDNQITISQGTPNYCLVNNYIEPIGADEQYRITWGNDTYIYPTIVDSREASYDGYFFGNPLVVGGTDDGSGLNVLFYRTNNTTLGIVTTDSTGDKYLKIEKKISSSSINLQAKTNIAPSTSSQTITADSGYDGLSSVQINAMPSMTLPTGSSSTSSGSSKATITPGASAQYLNIPTGYNGTAQYYTIAASGGSTPSGQTVTGTIAGTGTNTLEIPCSFAPNVIHIYGDLTGDVSLRGITKFTIIKDTILYVAYDGSTGNADESSGFINGITNYNESDTTNPHGSYSSNTFTVTTALISASYMFTSGITYSYKLIGSASGSSTPSATAHEIYFEFSDGTDTTIDVYYDDSLLGTMIKNNVFRGKLYNNKTISLAQLDGVTWYEVVSIPLNTQLVDYTTIKADYVVSETNGEEVSQQWGSCTGYIPIDPSMTFSYLNNRWTSMAFYDINKDYIRSLYTDNDKDSVDGNDMATGTLNSSKIPPSAYYIRMNCPYMADSSSEVSLIRTA